MIIRRIAWLRWLKLEVGHLSNVTWKWCTVIAIPGRRWIPMVMAAWMFLGIFATFGTAMIFPGLFSYSPSLQSSMIRRITLYMQGHKKAPWNGNKGAF